MLPIRRAHTQAICFAFVAHWAAHWAAAPKGWGQVPCLGPFAGTEICFSCICWWRLATLSVWRRCKLRRRWHQDELSGVKLIAYGVLKGICEHVSKLAGLLRTQVTLRRVRRPPNGPSPACQLSPSKGSSRVNGSSKMLFSYMVEASFTTTDLNLDINSTWLQNARYCTCLLAAARQQVKLSSRTLCPIFLRQIPPNHHGIDARTPLKPRPRVCAFLTHDC